MDQRLREIIRNAPSLGKLIDQEVVRPSPADTSEYNLLGYKLSLIEENKLSLKINLDDDYINILTIEEVKDNYFIVNLDIMEYFGNNDLIDSNIKVRPQIGGTSYKFSFPDSLSIISVDKDIVNENVILIELGLKAYENE